MADTRYGALTFVLFTAVLLGSWSLSARTASASDDDIIDMVAAGTVPTLVVSHVFLVADVEYAKMGRWLPKGWAITQLALPAAANLGVGSWFVVSGKPGLTGYWIAHFLLCGWYSVHGILSLAHLGLPGGSASGARGALAHFDIDVTDDLRGVKGQLRFQF